MVQVSGTSRHEYIPFPGEGVAEGNPTFCQLSINLMKFKKFRHFLYKYALELTPRRGYYPTTIAKEELYIL